MRPGLTRWTIITMTLFALFLVTFGLSQGGELTTRIDPDRGTLAVIPVNGVIAFGSDAGTSTIQPAALERLTEQAEEEAADVILYEINSGGGAVVASKEAARVVKEANVPTVCRLKEVAASGAYWLASACDVIVADSLTLTGSIGVTSAYLEFSGLLDKLGVEYVNLTAGEYKDMGAQFTNLTPVEREKFNVILDRVHEEFIRNVAENRNLSVVEVRTVATGELLLGSQALDHGLVDRLGGHAEAVDAAKELAGVSAFRTNKYVPPQRFNLLSLLFSKIGEGFATGIIERYTPRSQLMATK